MHDTITNQPDYIFEVSWEICNKVGGIYSVIATKASGIQQEFGNSYITIGPDVWKETSQNPDFIEDKTIFKTWRKKAERDGLPIKVGRWNIKERPIAILVDFTYLFPQKDKIFAEFWETYKLDSISGNWDYVEPALFGYASGKVIESFYDHYMVGQDRFIAHFHEWMSGAGVLYLRKNVPQAACVFTTHATVVGRCIASNGLPLYSEFENYKADDMAMQFNVKAKHSLEQLAAENSDAFTTVSELTGRECKQFLQHPADHITPNGFDDELIFEPENKKRTESRNLLLKVARAVLNQNLPDDSLLLVNSGRYEFRNKGIDVFIDSLAKLNEDKQLQQTVVAYIAIPAHHSGPVAGLLEKIDHLDFDNPLTGKYLTHGLFDGRYDQILTRLKEKNINNSPEEKVKVIFVPSYLNGDDGIFNQNYYTLLPGFDVAVFPSYYEPWGYTPLESLAFGVPTITTTLAGFGIWMQSRINVEDSLIVLERNDTDYESVVAEISQAVKRFLSFDDAHRQSLRENAVSLSKNALWSNLLIEYFKTFSIALEKVETRSDLFRDKRKLEIFENIIGTKHTQPEWRKVFIKHSFPKTLDPLVKLTRNLWWCWNSDVVELFRSINEKLWEACEQNPIRMLKSLSFNKLQELEKNADFMSRLKKVYDDFTAYMDKSAEKRSPRIAYFSMEYGLHDSVQIFSGGLGILAGDYLKEASDSNMDMIGIGLLYRYGYFRQALSPSGEQVCQYFPQVFNNLPMTPVLQENGERLILTVALPGRNLYAQAWRVSVGRIPLYLLDADIDKNQDADRFITHQLYGGDLENRFKQELLLGVGGIRMLQALNIEPDLYHCNEGHAAFIGIERLRAFVQDGNFSFEQALEIIRSSSLFTTHTPVPAGHDAFPEDMLRTYIPHYADRLNISWDTFMNLGRYTENKPDGKFSMSVLASKLSQEINGVSRIHGQVTREMFCGMYHGFSEEELHNIGYVTNGVHFPTWAAPKWKDLYKEVFGEQFLSDQSNATYWEKIQGVDDGRIWKIRQEMRAETIKYFISRLRLAMSSRQESPANLMKVMDALDKNALTIGFARRFATYKRAYLLFSNLDRLAAIVNNPKHPVQFVFAGKAHPADKAGADMIKRIIEISRMPQFTGKILFLENYNMELAKKLVQGVDIWLNTPTRPLEASGTSGEKAVMNGVVNFSVLDGWWAEGYRENAGWALPEENTYQDQGFQNELDATTIYDILEDEIVPTFYDRGEDGIPHKWVQYVKNTISEIAPHFTMKRQLDDYIRKFYTRLYDRTRVIRENNYEKARKIAKWKQKILHNWDAIEVSSVGFTDSNHHALSLGDMFHAEVVLNLFDIKPEDLCVEMIAGHRINDSMKNPTIIHELQLEHAEKNRAVFGLHVHTTNAGVFDFAFRITPKNDLLPHRLDFNLVKWA